MGKQLVPCQYPSQVTIRRRPNLHNCLSTYYCLINQLVQIEDEREVFVYGYFIYLFQTNLSRGAD